MNNRLTPIRNEEYFFFISAQYKVIIFCYSVCQLSVKSGKALLAVEEKPLHTRNWRPANEKKKRVNFTLLTSKTYRSYHNVKRTRIVVF